MYGLCFFMGQPMRTYVYVDGFNLYYRAVKNTPYKWLNIHQLCQSLLPKNQIIIIKYFTALITARQDDPGKVVRQQVYLRALKTLPNCEIIYGFYLSKETYMPVAGCAPGAQQFVKVIRTEEKGSDVNLAAHLVADGFKGEYEVAVVVSNDSDLVEPVRIVRQDLGLPVVVLNPNPKKPAFALKHAASFVKPIRQGALRSSQFPPVLEDSFGTFFKPESW